MILMVNFSCITLVNRYNLKINKTSFSIENLTIKQFMENKYYFGQFHYLNTLTVNQQVLISDDKCCII